MFFKKLMLIVNLLVLVNGKDLNPYLLPLLASPLSSAKCFSGLSKCCGLLFLSSFWPDFTAATLASPESATIFFSLNEALFLDLPVKPSLLWKVLSSSLACDFSFLCSLPWFFSSLSLILNRFFVSFHRPRSWIKTN